MLNQKLSYLLPSMNNNPGKGGKGKKAPYETTHYRIPEPLYNAVKMFADRYRHLIGAGMTDPRGEKLIKRVQEAICVDVDVIPVTKLKTQIIDGNNLEVEEFQSQLAILQEENAQLRSQLAYQTRQTRIAETRQGMLIIKYEEGLIRLKREVAVLPEENAELTQQVEELDKLANKLKWHYNSVACVVEQWQNIAESRQLEIERLQSQLQQAKPEAIAILENALENKPNTL